MHLGPNRRVSGCVGGWGKGNIGHWLVVLLTASTCCNDALCCVQTPIRDLIAKDGYTHFLALAEVAQITEPSSKAKLTILAPTNKVGLHPWWLPAAAAQAQVRPCKEPLSRGCTQPANLHLH